jgi:hypothetical protein
MKLEVTRFVCGAVPSGTGAARAHKLQPQPSVTEHGVQQRRKILLKGALPALCLALAVIAALALASSAIAQSNEDGSAAAAIAPNPPIPSAVKPSLVMQGATYATAGIALRNRGAGNISISGLLGAPTVAYIYWAVICPAAVCPAPATQIQIQRLYPLPAVGPAVLPGVQIGVGPSPCWGAGNVVVFRAPVPLGIATGNGSYQITILAGGQAIVNGSSPWGGFATPAWEGASLVFIAPSTTGLGIVSVYDAGLAGTVFVPVPAFNYTLALPVAINPGSTTFLDNIGADGQHFIPRGAILPVSDEATTVNGVPIAGPGSQYNDSDWNGSAGFTLTELWDDTAHDFTLPSTSVTNLLNISISGTGFPADCLVTVANVVQEN